jgi:hypothetical protein
MRHLHSVSKRCQFCSEEHDVGPLWWLDCTVCRDKETCPHPSVQVGGTRLRCDSCGGEMVFVDGEWVES